MLPSITFITGNRSKAEQLSQHLDFPILHKKLDLTEVQSLDPYEVIKHKAQEAYGILNQPVLVEDTSLIFHALGKLPGTLIKWFLTELHTDGLCKLIDGYDDRGAIASVKFGLYDGEKFSVFEGQINGAIANSPLGQQGFGWDPIFIPEGYAKTWGQMSLEEQKETSMRRIALKKLENYLKNA